jgi:hypothetical protein
MTNAVPSHGLARLEGLIAFLLPMLMVPSVVAAPNVQPFSAQPQLKLVRRGRGVVHSSNTRFYGVLRDETFISMTSIREFAEAAGVFKMEIRNAGLSQACKVQGGKSKKKTTTMLFSSPDRQMLTFLG